VTDNEPMAIDDNWPKPYQPDLKRLEQAEGEGPFMTAGVELMKEAGVVVTLAAALMPLSPHDRDSGILCGLTVRISKLMHLAIREICHDTTLTMMGVARQIIDSAGTLVYLLDPSDPERFDRYVQDSLIAEREYLRTVEKNAHDRGHWWPIEERIKRSIVKTAKAAGIDDVMALPARKDVKFPSASDRIGRLSPTAYEVFRMGSDELHGGWNDLYRNHLTTEDGTFSPNFDGLHCRPQVPLGLTLAATLGVRDCPEAVVAGAGAQFDPRFDDLLDRAERVDELHEQLLSKS
jgi:hypothetical protein